MALVQLAHKDFDIVPVRQYDAAEWSMLNHIRLMALKCRSAARSDLFEACALLSMSRSTRSTGFADAFVRCWEQASNQRLRMHSPGVSELTFDELWIMSVARAHVHDDQSSFSFMIQSRVLPHARRNVAFLLARIVDTFSQG